MSDIFISYASEDRELAKMLAHALGNQGWSVWWDRKIPFGKTYDEVIAEHLATARCVIVLWTHHSVKSRWVRTEASEAADRNALIPILMTTEIKIPLQFKLLQTANLFDWKSGDVAHPEFERLLAHINELLAAPQPAVQPEPNRPGNPTTIPAMVVPDSGEKPNPRKKALLILGIIVSLIVLAGSVTYAMMNWRVTTRIQADLIGDRVLLVQDIDTLRSGIVKLVATIDGRQKTGTGFIVQHKAGNILIVTAAHVVEGDKFPKAEFYGRRNDPIEAEVLRIEGGDRRGIALLKVRNVAHVPQNARALPFAASEHVQDGEDLMTIGFPSGGGSWDVLRISITSREGRDLLLSGDLEEGNSGGPILKQGKVIGLVTSMDRRGQAIPAQIVELTLQGWGVAIAAGGKDVPASTSTSTKPATETRLPIEPEMVRIPSGKFLMGSPGTEANRRDNESPQHEVTIAPFVISRSEITVEQFRQFVQDEDYHQGKVYQTAAEQNGKGCWFWNGEKEQPELLSEHNWKNPGFDQSDDHPVVCVSWNDAQAYVTWLSHRAGLKYRLPTEAEWEYAARAGTTTAHFYPDGKQCDYANGAAQEARSLADQGWILANCSDGYVYTAPVASFGQNPFGLFDMLGNVAEWTQDCLHENYINAPTDGSAWLKSNGDDCTHRGVRGGSWGIDSRGLRSAVRGGFSADVASYFLGFRIARAL